MAKVNPAQFVQQVRQEAAKVYKIEDESFKEFKLRGHLALGFAEPDTFQDYSSGFQSAFLSMCKAPSMNMYDITSVRKVADFAMYVHYDYSTEEAHHAMQFRAALIDAQCVAMDMDGINDGQGARIYATAAGGFRGCEAETL